jgi:hypothetical protein
VGTDDNLADSLAGDGLGALLPFGNTIGERVFGAVRREYARNTSRALKAATASSGLSREDFEEWLEREPRAIPLFMKVLWAAGMNGHDATLRAMGAVLGHAAKATTVGGSAGDEAMQRAELALQAMSDLGPLHFRVLAVLDESVVVVMEDSDNFIQFTPGYVSEKAGLSEPLTSQCLLNLATSGLTELTSVYDGNAFPLTDLGRAVLRASQEVA